MDFVLQHKWTFLILAECLFWIGLISFIVARYWLESNRGSLVIAILFIANDLWIAVMGWYDYKATGTFSSYQIVTLIIIVYALTYGKSDFKRLDRWIKRRLTILRKEPIPPDLLPASLYGREKAKAERKQVYVHAGVFIGVHLIFLILYGFNDLTSLPSLNEWFSSSEAKVPFGNTTINGISRIWVMIFVIDTLSALSYTIFPKQRTPL
ncbi:hypothetical protein N781_05320 [Pontibacillus halophilus JSM 076056 = DSM 19796]|uniref:Integral membrane protein n=1 Tax=Pontibacillus halophilus JSM 076056 = DSM 19796 TaxID=1385510 RepID=A0A0A5GIR3_9BACI|nr:hypothetical protein [Pontibacillus halophilus]KGX91113.1 hypothetical protein N781_05320 [Pontibacillus halophilus JSM 076056 = DSM 19796]